MHAYCEWAAVFCWHPLSLELKDIGWMEDIQWLPPRGVDCSVQRLFIDLLQPRRVRLQQTDRQTDRQIDRLTGQRMPVSSTVQYNRLSLTRVES